MNMKQMFQIHEKDLKDMKYLQLSTQLKELGEKPEKIQAWIG